MWEAFGLLWNILWYLFNWNVTVVYNCILRKLFQQRCTFMTSFACSLKKEAFFSNFQQTAHSSSPQKAYRSKPRPLFSNCIQNDVTTVRCCWTSFLKKSNFILLLLILNVELSSSSKFLFVAAAVLNIIFEMTTQFSLDDFRIWLL